MTDTDPMAIQHGGTHYKGMKIEPFEMSLANHYDGAVHSILKYVSRHAAKGGAEDLWKAHHIVAIRLKMLLKYAPSHPTNRIPMATYVGENSIPAREAEILFALEHWIGRFHTPWWHGECAKGIQKLLADTIQFHYPDSPSPKA